MAAVSVGDADVGGQRPVTTHRRAAGPPNAAITGYGRARATGGTAAAVSTKITVEL